MLPRSTGSATVREIVRTVKAAWGGVKQFAARPGQAGVTWARPQIAPGSRVSSIAAGGEGGGLSPSEGTMSSQKIVRCQLRRAGSAGPGQARYVPLEIFGLWEHLMRSKHGFEVLEPRASLWLDME